MMPHSLSFTTTKLLSSTTSFVPHSMAASHKTPDLCSTLSSQFPDQVSYASDAAYSASVNSYFYQQARLAPQCIVFTESATDVSSIIKILAGMRGKAAIRGRGHSPIANAANIDGAVTIDLSRMDTVNLGTAYSLGLSSTSISSDFLSSSIAGHVWSDATGGEATPNTPKILSAGGGATWGDVYRKLDSTGLISIGGRGTSLGIGGLIAGGQSILQLQISNQSFDS